jgi:hypothetical protein
VVIDFDLSSNVYPKLDDIISSNTIPLDMRLSILENNPVTLNDIGPFDQDLSFVRGTKSYVGG